MSDEEFVWVRMRRETIEGYIRGFTRNRIAYDEALEREPSVLLPEATVREWRGQTSKYVGNPSAKTRRLLDAIDAALPAATPEPWAVGDAVIKHTNSPMTGEVVWVGRRGLTILWPDQPVPMTYSVGNSYLETFRRPDALDTPVPLPEAAS